VVCVSEGCGGEWGEWGEGGGRGGGGGGGGGGCALLCTKGGGLKGFFISFIPEVSNM